MTTRTMQAIVSDLSDDQIGILLNCCAEELLYRGYVASETACAYQEALDAQELDRSELDWEEELPF